MPRTLEDDYAGAGFGGSLPFGKSAAVIFIDVVMAYVDPASPLYLGPENALAEMARLHDVARAAEVPVIFTNIEYGPDGAEGGVCIRERGAVAEKHSAGTTGVKTQSSESRRFAQGAVLTCRSGS